MEGKTTIKDKILIKIRLLQVVTMFIFNELQPLKGSDSSSRSLLAMPKMAVLALLMVIEVIFATLLFLVTIDIFLFNKSNKNQYQYMFQVCYKMLQTTKKCPICYNLLHSVTICNKSL